MARFSWLRDRKKTEPEIPFVSPIPLGNLSNGEYFHFQSAREAKLEKEVLRKLDENARKVGMDRREFASTAMGMATALYVVHTVGCSSKTETNASGGSDAGIGTGDAGGPEATPLSACNLPPAATLDDGAACSVLNADDFIFDIQTHHFDPTGDWRTTNVNYANYIHCNGGGYECFSRDSYVSGMFMHSDTTMSVLSAWPAVLCGPDANPRNCGLPLDNDQIALSRDAIDLLAHSQRVINHCFVMPNDPGGIDAQLALMDRVCSDHQIGGWKCYPAYGAPPPGGTGGVGFWLDDPETGIPFIQHGLDLGVNCFSIHKGLPIPGFDFEHNKPTEIGRVAKMFPDANLIIYHSAICSGIPGNGSGFCSPSGSEMAYDENAPTDSLTGTNLLCRALFEAGIPPGSNVYAELGSAWVQVMNNPTAAGHFIGKLLKFFGPKNICWGTDCILYGSPQPQIMSFRAFQIPADIVDFDQIPNLDDIVDGTNLTVRQHIFGINAARIYKIDVEARRCAITQLAMHKAKEELDDRAGPGRFMLTPAEGPKTWAEFLENARRAKAWGVPA